MTDTNAESLIAAMDQLGLTPGQVAARMGVAVAVIKGVRAGVLWRARIPEPPAIAAAEIIGEAERNGHHAVAAEMDNPIELPQDDAGGDTPADESALRVIEAAEASEADALKALRNELLAECETVDNADQPAADAIMKQAIRGGIDERNGAQQIQATLRPRLKLTTAQMKAHWARCKAEVVPPTTKEFAAPAQAGEQKPRLEIQEGHPDRTVSDLRDIHAASGRIFERAGPVRVFYDKESDGPVAHQLNVSGLILETHFVSQPWRFDQKGGEKDVDLPASHAQMYLAWTGERRLPPLNGFTTAPILSSDGSIRTARGYDAATGLFCERVPDVAPLVPANPTRAEAEAALLLVRNVVKTFPFKDAITHMINGVRTVELSVSPGMDESSFLTSLLGSVCRPSLWLAPGSLFAGAKASGSGVGKGLLVRIVCAIAYGRRPIAIGPGGNNEELEKRISAAFLQGGPMVFLDNFNDLTLKSSALESALTERPSQVRQFGTLDMVAINALASVFITGNAVGLGLDSIRRFVRTEFDAQVEDAEGREFSGNILAEVMVNRPVILAALLTIWRYGQLAPDIKRGLPFGS
ncbi:MAG TPA: hypothetical protein VFE60_01030 [Roseiarcus sp.]|nr:hypothetical protein [Roseiarcus sp.]